MGEEMTLAELSITELEELYLEEAKVTTEHLEEIERNYQNYMNEQN